MSPQLVASPTSIVEVVMAAAGRNARARMRRLPLPTVPSPVAFSTAVPAAVVANFAVESLVWTTVTDGFDDANVNFTFGTRVPFGANARATTDAVSPAITVSEAGVTSTRETLAMTVTSVLLLSPQTLAVILAVPGLSARTIPSESTVATVGSDDSNSNFTSERAEPVLPVATAASRTVSDDNAGECTRIVAEDGDRKISRTGFVTSHMKPGPVSVSSSQAASPKPTAMIDAVSHFRLIIYFSGRNRRSVRVKTIGRDHRQTGVARPTYASPWGPSTKELTVCPESRGTPWKRAIQRGRSRSPLSCFSLYSRRRSRRR